MRTVAEILNTQELVDPFDPSGKNFLVKAEHWARYTFVVKNYRKLINQKCVIYDVGCGSGYGTDILYQAGACSYGFEVNEEFLSVGKQIYPAVADRILQTDLNKQSLLKQSSKFNLPLPQIITSFETLEHLENPRKVLSDFFQLLKPGGILVISVPSDLYESVKNSKPANPFHLHFFNPLKTRNMLRNAGFRKIQSFGQPWTNLIIRSKRKKIIRSLNRYLQNKNLFMSRAWLLARPTKLFISKSNSLIFICHKPGL